MADRKIPLGSLPDRHPPLRNRAATRDAAHSAPRGIRPLRDPPPSQSSNPLVWLWLGAGAAFLAVILGLIYFYTEGGFTGRRPMTVDILPANVAESAEGTYSAGAERRRVEKNRASKSADGSGEPQATENVGATPAEETEPNEGQQRTREVFGDPFAKLPDAIELPVPSRGQEGFTNRQGAPFEIGPLVNAADAEVELTLADGAASLGDGFGLHIATAQNTKSKWEVRLVEETPPAAPQALIHRVPEEPVATIFIETGSLKFAWGAASDHPDAEQLRNCALRLSSGVYLHQLRLRPIQLVEAFVFDAEESTFDVVIKGRGLPVSERMYLDLSALHGFPGQWKATPPKERVGPSEELSISSGGTPHVEIVAELRELHEKPTVRIRCYYYQDDNRKVLAKESFEDQLTRTQASLARNRRSLSSFQSALPVVQSKLSNALAWVPRNGQESAWRAGLISDFGRQLIRCESGIARLTKLIPKNEAAVAELQAVAQLANQIHKHATVEFEVGVLADGGDFPLLIATTGTQSLHTP